MGTSSYRDRSDHPCTQQDPVESRIGLKLLILHNGSCQRSSTHDRHRGVHSGGDPNPPLPPPTRVFVQMDYNKYFEDRLNRQKFRSGAEEAQFVEFSLNALQTAQSRIVKFLSLFSRNDVEQARKEIEKIYE